jgi:hypothetical protein
MVIPVIQFRVSYSVHFVDELFPPKPTGKVGSRWGLDFRAPH